MIRIVTLVLLLMGLAACVDDMTEDSDMSSEGTSVGASEGEGTTSDSALVASSSDVGTSPGGNGNLTEIQSGTLTSADIDDLLNPELFDAYLSELGQSNLFSSQIPFILLANSVVVDVQDLDGNPLSGATVGIASQDKQVNYKTPSNGLVYTLPIIENLSGEVTVSVSYNNVVATKTVNIDEIGNDRVIPITVETFAIAPTKLDLMLVVDTTGSMGDELDYLKVELNSILDQVRVDLAGVEINLGMVFYRDSGELYVTREFALSDDIDQMLTDLAVQSYAGGGDYPEAMDKGIEAALYQFI